MTWLPRLRLERAVDACSGCVFFDARPAQIETHLRGMNSLSSGFASVRGDDGLCAKHQRLVGAAATCAHFRGHVQRTTM